jgi:charged multivesicular body protein 2A
MMDMLFGQRKTPAEMLRQHQRSLNKAVRDLDREKSKLEQQEKKLIADIRKSARAGQMGASKVMAKDLVRTRRYVQKFYNMRTQLQAVGLRIQVCYFSLICSWNMLHIVIYLANYPLHS